MKFTIKNDLLTQNIKKISRLLVKNNSFPILENILMEIKNDTLFLTTTNLEIELISKIKIFTKNIAGKITVSGRKMLNICKNLLPVSEIKIQLKKNKIHISSENSNYILTTLPADNFPNHQDCNSILSFEISSNSLRSMIEKTAFSMGKQDVRHYLNGILLEKKGNTLKSIATDGYRLAVSSTNIKEDIKSFSIIMPNKGVLELYRLLNIKKKLLKIFISNNNIKIYINDLIFTSQLIEGKYPDYNNVLFSKKDNPIVTNTALLKKSLLRTAILTHEKFCGIEIKIENKKFKILSDNQEEESAEDTFNTNYSGDTIEISINVYYILDVLNAIDDENILIFFNSSKSSIQIESENDSSNIYVIMLLKR